MRRENSIKDCFDHLYQTYYKDIYRFVYRILDEADGANDITQETFTLLYQNQLKKSIPGNIKTWLYKVTYNICMTKLSREKRYLSILKNKDQIIDNLHSKKNQNMIDLFKKEKSESIRKAYSSLPLRDQMVINLKQDEMSYSQIAKIIGVKESSIGKLLFRAKKNLANKLIAGGIK